MKAVLAIVCLLLIGKAGAQSWVTGYLSAPITDAEYQRVQLQEAYLAGENFNSPWFRELELRINTTSGSQNLEEYRLRLGILNPMEIKANRDYKKLMDIQMVAEREQVVNAVLQRRYELLIEHHYLKGRLALHQAYEVELAQEQQVLLQAEGSLRSLIDVEEALTKLKLDGIELTQKLRLVDNVLSEQVPGALEWEGFDLVTKESVLLGIEGSGEEGYLVREARRAYEVREKLLNIDKAQAYSNIGYIQGEYEDDPFGLTSENLGFQFGFQIPVFNRDRPDLQRKKLRLIEEETEIQEAVDEEALLQEDLKAGIQAAYGQLVHLEAQLQRIDTYDDLYQQLASDIRTLIKLENFRFYLKEKQLEVQYELLRNFIEVLHLRGELSGTPATNYLSKGFASFEIAD